MKGDRVPGCRSGVITQFPTFTSKIINYMTKKILVGTALLGQSRVKFVKVEPEVLSMYIYS